MLNVQDLLDEIKLIKIEPGIFKVFVMASSHLSGYDAWVLFRTDTKRDWMNECRTHGNTPEEALLKLSMVLNGIKALTCPHCGMNIEHDAKGKEAP